MARAIVGSILGSVLTLFLFLEGPQVFQRGIALISDTGAPEALAAAGLVAYLAGIVGNHQRPHRWSALAIWAGGSVAGFLIFWLYAYVNRPVPA